MPIDPFAETMMRERDWCEGVEVPAAEERGRDAVLDLLRAALILPNATESELFAEVMRLRVNDEGDPDADPPI